MTVRQTCENKAGDADPDEFVLEYARRHKRVLLTRNRKHFERLHEASPGHEGIITCVVEADYKSQAKRLDELIKSRPRFTGEIVHLPAENAK